MLDGKAAIGGHSSGGGPLLDGLRPNADAARQGRLTSQEIYRLLQGGFMRRIIYKQYLYMARSTYI